MRTQAKTLIEKHGFIDADRKNSKHDEIQLWTYEHAHEVLNSFNSSDKTIKINYATLEYPIAYRTTYNKMLVGYVDLFLSGEILDQSGQRVKGFLVSIEVKSKIECCGDLIRQINFYRGYQDYETTWIVVSPDDRWQKILKEQNIYFFKYKSPGELF